MSELPPGAIPGRADQRSIEDFDDSYKATPPWDIGRPQPVFVAAADAGRFRGRVLDAGCGTGEHTLMLAARGLDVVGVDAAPRAIASAQCKAAERSASARFLVWDALRLGGLEKQFDDLRAAFSVGWTIEFIEPAEFATNVGSGIAQAWLMVATRT